MSELFEMYEENFNELLKKVKNIINSMSNLSREKSESAIKQADTHLSEAKQYLKKLDIEASTGNNKEKLYTKIKSYNQEYNKIESEYLKAANNYINVKSNEAIYLNSDENKNTQINEIAYNQSNKLDSGLAGVIGIENRGVEVLRDLEHHTGQMNRVNENLDGFNYSLGTSNSLLTKMLRRENRNKLMIIGAAIVFSFIFILIAIVRISGKNSETNTDNTELTMNNDSNKIGYTKALNLTNNS